MPKKLEYNATIVARRDITGTLATFRVATDAEVCDGATARPFLPGQYVTAALPAPNGDWIQRPFSIASAPEDRTGLELYVRKVAHPVSEAPFSHLIFDRHPSDRIYVRPAATGRFTLSHTIGVDNRIVKLLVAAGTGVAPFMSMIRSRALGTSGALDDLVLMHGVSFPDELAYEEELSRLARERGLRYLTTISRPHCAPTWTGTVGRVNELLSPARIRDAERMLGISIVPEDTAVFVCGLHEMIAGVIEDLMPRGYVPAHRRIRALHAIPEGVPTTLFYEQYDDAPLVSRGTERHSVA